MHRRRRVEEWLHDAPLLLDAVLAGEAHPVTLHRGFEEDLVVDAEAEWFVKWHMGWVPWADALAGGHITVTGDRALARALPTWNKLSRFAGVKLEQAAAVDGASLARVRVSLTGPSEYRVRSARNTIRVELTASTAQAKPDASSTVSVQNPLAS